MEVFMTIKKSFITFMVICILMLSGCQSPSASVSVTLYPIQYLVERIGGEYVEVNNISDNTVIQGATPVSNYEETLENSSMLFFISGLEPYFDVYQVGIRNSNVPLIDLMSQGVFSKFERYTTTTSNGTTITVETPFYEGDTFSLVDTYDEDPSFWMDPIAMIGAAEIVRDYLSSKYPDHTAYFQENFEKLEIDLAVLDSKYQDLKNTGTNISFVSMSPNFGSWQKAYGFNVYPVILSKYGALPSNTQLTVIKQRIIDDGVQYIAKEDNLTPEMQVLYAELVEELGLQEIELNNLTTSGESLTAENKDYLTMMYDNLTSLEALIPQ